VIDSVLDYAPRACRTSTRSVDAVIVDDETITIGSLEVRLMHTPGRTLACASYALDDDVLIGDTVFVPDYGSVRCDFPGGNATSSYASARRLLAVLEAPTLLLPAIQVNLRAGRLPPPEANGTRHLKLPLNAF
jgi:glyoxylase-like metal-dependent hydrolase (beta-lactamase superfamily II)